ncbi:MAG: hypothetical protein AB2A00_32025 [Myxococcota bacterium]
MRLRAWLVMTTVGLGGCGSSQGAQKKDAAPAGSPEQCFTGTLVSTLPDGTPVGEAQVALVRTADDTRIRDVVTTQLPGGTPEQSVLEMKVNGESVTATGEGKGEGQALGAPGKWTVVNVRVVRVDGTRLEHETALSGNQLTVTRRLVMDDGNVLTVSEGQLTRTAAEECAKRQAAAQTTSP